MLLLWLLFYLINRNDCYAYHCNGHSDCGGGYCVKSKVCFKLFLKVIIYFFVIFFFEQISSYSRCQCSELEGGPYCNQRVFMPSCGKGWVKPISVFAPNNKNKPQTSEIVCIELHSTPETFAKAKTICKNKGGHLIGIGYGTPLKEKIDPDKVKSLKHEGIWLNIVQGENNLRKLYVDANEPIEISFPTKTSINFRISAFDLHKKCPHLNDMWSFLNLQTNQLEIPSSDCQTKKPFICEKAAPAAAILIPNTSLCENEWLYSVTENRCYKYFSQKTNFTEAQKICDNHQSQLPCPGDTIENLVVANASKFSQEIHGCGSKKNPCKNGGICLYNERGFEKCQCPNDFIGNYCERISPSALLKNHTICPPGKYLLPYCQMICKCQNDELCNSQTGECPGLACKKGWYGPQCNIFAPIERVWLDVQNFRFDPICSNQKKIDKNFYFKSTENKFPGDCIVINAMIFERNQFWTSVNCEEKRNFVCVADAKNRKSKFYFINVSSNHSFYDFNFNRKLQ